MAAVLSTGSGLFVVPAMVGADDGREVLDFEARSLRLPKNCVRNSP